MSDKERIGAYEQLLKFYKRTPIKFIEKYFGKLKWYQKIQLRFLLWKGKL